MIFLKFYLINNWRENQKNLYVMKIFILLIYQLFHLTSFSLSLRPLLTEVCIDLANWTDLNKVKGTVAQSCPTLCDPIDYTVHGILQARILEWVAVPFSRGSSQPRDWTQVACIAGRFFTSWTTGKPKNPFSRRSSQTRNWTRVSCIAYGFFTNWVIREAPFWTKRLQFSTLWLWLICMLLAHKK